MPLPDHLSRDSFAIPQHTTRPILMTQSPARVTPLSMAHIHLFTFLCLVICQPPFRSSLLQRKTYKSQSKCTRTHNKCQTAVDHLLASAEMSKSAKSTTSATPHLHALHPYAPYPPPVPYPLLAHLPYTTTNSSSYGKRTVTDRCYTHHTDINPHALGVLR